MYSEYVTCERTTQRMSQARLTCAGGLWAGRSLWEAAHLLDIIAEDSVEPLQRGDQDRDQHEHADSANSSALSRERVIAAAARDADDRRHGHCVATPDRRDFRVDE